MSFPKARPAPDAVFRLTGHDVLAALCGRDAKNSGTDLLIHFCAFWMLLGGATMETFINFPNWFAEIPASLTRVTQFLAVRNPGMFFQTVAPATILAGILFVLVGWRTGAARNFIGASVLILVGVELATFNLVYPKLRILLGRGDQAGLYQSAEELTRVANDFLVINSWRLAGMFLAGCLTAVAVAKFFGMASREAEKPL